MGLYLLDIMGTGQRAFCEGLLDLGFQLVPYEQLEPLLVAGNRVIVNGWWMHYGTLAEKYPGQLAVLWHSSLTGSDVMGEGGTFSAAHAYAKQGLITLFWLESRDAPPPGTRALTFFWSPRSIYAMLPDVMPTRQKNHVVAGLHGDYPSAAKNIVANVWGAANAGAHVHLSRSVYDDEGPRGRMLRSLLDGKTFTLHDVMSRREVIQLLASSQVLVHVSLSDTWSFQVLEALYVGTPVVISKECGVSRLVGGVVNMFVELSTLSGDIDETVADLLQHHPHRAESEQALTLTRKLLDSYADAKKQAACEQLRNAGFAV